MRVYTIVFLASVYILMFVLGFARPAPCEVFTTGMLRCGPEVVRTGDSMYVVKLRCGEPTEVQHMDAVLGGGAYGRSHAQNITPTTVMIYNCGSTDFIYKLTFTGDTLTNIQALDRGFGSGTCR